MQNDLLDINGSDTFHRHADGISDFRRSSSYPFLPPLPSRGPRRGHGQYNSILDFPCDDTSAILHSCRCQCRPPVEDKDHFVLHARHKPILPCQKRMRHYELDGTSETRRNLCCLCPHIFCRSSRFARRLCSDYCYTLPTNGKERRKGSRNYFYRDRRLSSPRRRRK